MFLTDLLLVLANCEFALVDTGMQNSVNSCKLESSPAESPKIVYTCTPNGCPQVYGRMGPSSEQCARRSQ